MKPKLNAPCPCGSGKKYKRCCALKKNEAVSGFAKPGKTFVPSWARPLLDIFVGALIFWVAWEPNFAHGLINYHEVGQYLSVIHELLKGKLLFKDLFVQYGPLQFYLPAWLMRLLGEHLAVHRGVLLAGEIAGLLTVYLIALRLIPNRLFAYAAALGAAIQSHHPFWSSNWGGFRFAAAYLSVLCLLGFMAKRKRLWLFLGGLLATIAFLFTPEAGVTAYFAGTVFLVAYSFGGEKEPGLWKNYTLGAALGWIPFLVFALATRSLGAYLTQLASMGPGRAYVQPILPGDLGIRTLYPLAVYAVALLFLIFKWVRHRQIDAGVFAIGACGFPLYVFAFRALRGPQFDFALPLAVILAFYLFWNLFETGRRASNRLLQYSGTAAALLFILIPNRFFENPGAWLRYQAEKNNLVAEYRQAFPKNETVAIEGPPLLRTLLVSRGQAEEIEGTYSWITSHTRPSDSLFGYPDLGLFNAICDRPHVTRFTMPVLAAPYEKWAKEVLEAVETQKPKIILRRTKLSTIAQALGLEKEVLPETGAKISSSYPPRKKTGAMVILTPS